jgi:hypothetical protein
MTGRPGSPSLPPDLWTERDLATYIADLARLGGWLRYHTHDSRRSPHGFPDEVLVHPGRGLVLFRELKTANGKLGPEQTRWLDALTAAGANAELWRPNNLDKIENLLLRRTAR